MNKSSNYIRKQAILDGLSCCDSHKDRLSCAIDLIMQLQDDLFELQQNYMELLLHCKSLKQDICVQLLF